MIIAILGRQPEISHAELSSLYEDTILIDNQFTLINKENDFDIQRVGGAHKAGRVIKSFPARDDKRAFDFLARDYFKSQLLPLEPGKITLGISSYNGPGYITTKKLLAIGLHIKKQAKTAGRSLRLVPNKDLVLNSATSHHNKLGLSESKRELLVIFTTRSIYIAESLGAQNITALSERDQKRPARDAFVGMLPPKLALMMVNIAAGQAEKQGVKPSTILDPFCGTGVVLQESWIRGFSVIGTDLSDKMIDYSGRNLDWLQEKYPRDNLNSTLEQGDAMTHTWPLDKSTPSTAVVCETYLGQPFSAPPRDAKLEEVRTLCNSIVSSFLKNIHQQLPQGSTLCVAVPAWTTQQGDLSRLPVIKTLGKLGYEKLNNKDLIYKREDQVVARDILVLRRN